MTRARQLQPPLRAYRGSRTDPARWATWVPRAGDILVCTPPKCGTTWTQTMLAMLVHGGPELPGKVPFLSPWVDADLGIPAPDVAAALDRQTTRRVVKTHTPADGFPVWEGVTVITVYRHPLDVFFSLRKHVANMTQAEADELMLLPLPQSLAAYLDRPDDPGDWDNDSLANVARHYSKTVLSGRLPGLHVFHYADMVADRRGAVERLARAAGIVADAALIDRVAAATAFATMKARAADYAPAGGTDFWKSEGAFFDSASSRKWQGQLTEAQLDHYRQRIAALVPDDGARAWLEQGAGPVSRP